jgi:hypothetical protein
MMKYIATSDRSKKTKKRMRSAAAKSPRLVDCRNRKSAACARGARRSCHEYVAQATDSTAVSTSRGMDSPSTPTW